MAKRRPRVPGTHQPRPKLRPRRVPGESQTYWNGEPCEARKVSVMVADSEAPRYWARSIVGTRRDAVEVKYGGDIFYLDDAEWTRPKEEVAQIRRLFPDSEVKTVLDAGGAWRKLTAGFGTPAYGHRELKVVKGSVQPRQEGTETP